MDLELTCVCLRDQKVYGRFGDVLTLRDGQLGEDDVGSFLVETGREASEVLDCLDHVVCHFGVFDYPALQQGLS